MGNQWHMSVDPDGGNSYPGSGLSAAQWAGIKNYVYSSQGGFPLPTVEIVRPVVPTISFADKVGGFLDKLSYASIGLQNAPRVLVEKINNVSLSGNEKDLPPIKTDFGGYRQTNSDGVDVNNHMSGDPSFDDDNYLPGSLDPYGGTMGAPQSGIRPMDMAKTAIKAFNDGGTLGDAGDKVYNGAKRIFDSKKSDSLHCPNCKVNFPINDTDVHIEFVPFKR
jgi:hypothetical protein